MRRGLEAVLRRLHASDPAYAAREDLAGPHGAAFRLFRDLGFLAAEPVMNPVPSCPHCLEGSPYRIGERFLCPACGSGVDPDELRLWPFRLEQFLAWLAGAWNLRGGVEPIAAELWRLGTLSDRGAATECFYLRGRELPGGARARLLAYRSALVVHGASAAPRIDGFEGETVALIERLDATEERLTDLPLVLVPPRGGIVRLDADSGTLRAGDTVLGYVPPGSREFHFLDRLCRQPGVLVPYAELKHHVARMTGSRDATDEATFCQKLKWRLRTVHGIAAVDRILQTDRRLGGYRLSPEAALDGNGSPVGA